MKSLIDLHPRWTGLLRLDSGEGIVFDCPSCGPSHSLCAYFSNPVDGKEHAPWQQPLWERNGESFETLTISPSIQYSCFHGWVENGTVIDVSESPLRAQIKGKLVALSPLQSIDAIKQMIGLAR